MFLASAKNLAQADLFNLGAFNQSSPTYVNGIIDTNTTWTAANSPYIVSSNILVETGATLTIEPGVTVKFAGKYYLMVKGNLKAQGNSSSLITFTSNAPSPSWGDWEGIQTSEYDANLNLNYCKIQYANTAVYSAEADTEISNSEFSMNSIGISVKWYYRYYHTGRNISGTISKNSIASNDLGIKIDIHYDVRGGLRIEDNEIAYNWEGMKISFFHLSGFVLSVVRNRISLNGQVGVEMLGSIYEGSFVNMTQNCITFNDNVGIAFVLWGYPEILRLVAKDNDLHNNKVYDFLVSQPLGEESFDYTLDVGENYWGTTNTTLVDSKIYDFYDDYKLGKANYVPLLTSSLESRYPDAVLHRLKPRVSIASPVNGTSVTSSDIGLIWSSERAGIDHYEVRLDDSTWTNVVGTADSFTFSGLGNGPHKVEVKAVDRLFGSSVASVNFIAAIPPSQPQQPDLTPLVYIAIAILIAVGSTRAYSKWRNRSRKTKM